MILTRVVDAESEAVSLIDLKQHLRIDEAEDHDVLNLLITAVRHAVEEHIERSIITTQWKVELDGFPALGYDRLGTGVVATNDILTLPMQPIQSIQSIQYYDSADVQQTLSAPSYQFDVTGRVKPVSGTLWPTTYPRINAVEVNYTAGYTDAGQIPENLRLALKLLIGHYEQNREDSAFSQVNSIPNGAKYLLNPFRTHRI